MGARRWFLAQGFHVVMLSESDDRDETAITLRPRSAVLREARRFGAMTFIPPG
jgi:hypothetical protein